MKKTLLIVLIVCMLWLAGCESAAPAPTAPGKAGETVATTAAIPEETTEPTQEETTTEETVPPVAGIQGTTLYNEDKFALVLTDLTADKNGETMTFTAINRTDMLVYMRLMNFSANGFMMETLPTVILEPQEIKEASLTLPAKELAYNGIEEITDLQFNLWVYDSEDFKTPDVADGLCRYYPNGKAAAATYERKPQPEDRVLVDNERFTVTVTSVTVDKNITLEVHLKNKSDKELLFIAPYSTLDGTVIDPLWAYNVSAGKQRNTVITYTAKDMKAEGIAEPKVLELPIQIGDHADWSAGVYFFEVYTVTLVEEPVEETTEETTTPTA